jgi:alanine dehydrogenase
MPIYTCVIQPKILEKSLMRCDVAIGAIRSQSGRTPSVVTDDMVQKMKPGSVIVDVSIDQGGCFETSELRDLENPSFTKYDVIHYCVPNIASRVSRTATFSLSNILAPILLSIGDYGGVEEILRDNKGVNKGLYLCKGILVSKSIGDFFDLPYAEDSRLLY